MNQYLTTALAHLPPAKISDSNITHQSFSMSNSTNPLDSHLVLFSTAGTGKTRYILDILDKHWGVYMVASGTPTGYSNLLRPVRCGASADTSSLLQDWDIMESTTRTRSIQSIVEARQILFHAFRDRGKKSGQSTIFSRHNWMRLQISCTEDCDPFDAIWRLIRFIPTISWKYYHSEYDALKYWCIDEAQVAFDGREPNSILPSLLKAIDHLPSFDCFVIIAGTSLRLKQVQEFMKAEVLKWLDPPPELKPGFKTVTEFPVIETSESFWALFKDHFWNLVAEMTQQTNALQEARPPMPLVVRAGRALDFEFKLSGRQRKELDRLRRLAGLKGVVLPDPAEPDLDKLYQDISNKCTYFFGRYRWSTLFIEQLLKGAISAITSPPDGDVSTLSVSGAVDSSVELITHALSNQLKRIQNEPWIEDLYWMAIRADLFSQSSIMEDDSACLISEGFALVKPFDQDCPKKSKKKAKEKSTPGTTDNQHSDKLVRVMLCEPLTVHVVMEHLRTSGKLEKTMNKFFALLQLDNMHQTAIGTMSEYLLTSVSSLFYFTVAMGLIKLGLL